MSVESLATGSSVSTYGDSTCTATESIKTAETSTDQSSTVYPICNKACLIPGRTETLSDDGLNNVWDHVISDQSVNETEKYYSIWGDGYDTDMKNMSYVGHKVTAQHISDILKLDKQARILDIGCGTGLFGQEMALKGYTNIDGFDVSDDILRLAKKKNVYKNLQPLEVNELRPSSATTNAKYDCIVFCTSLMPGHVPAKALLNIATLLKDNGYILWCNRVLETEKTINTDFEEEKFSSIITDLSTKFKLESLPKVAVEKLIDNKPGVIQVLQRKP